ncbi:MAG: NAD(P)/FAD-dependent oxidoreductase [Aggregatilineales bacterium]
MMSISIWQADETQPVREVDFLIIGAGLVGCAAAYFAGQAGHEVIITEKADVGMGASGRNAGFMITGLDSYYHRATEKYGEAVTREMWALSNKSIHFWKGIVSVSDGAVPMDVDGSYLLAETPAEAKDLELAAKALDTAGIEMNYYDHDPLGRGYYAAIEHPQDAAVQPYKLAREVLRRSGAELIAGNEMYHFEQVSPEVVRVHTQKCIFEARYVLLCTNAYSPFVDPYFVDKVIPTRAQVLATAPLETKVLPKPGYSNYGYMYYRSTHDNRLLIGGGRNRHFDLEANTTEDKISHPVQRTLDAYLQQYFPEVDAPIERRWGGIMGFSVDGLPLVGTLPEKSRVGFAVGFTGHGLSMGAGTAERAVDKLLNGTHAGAVDTERLHE